jgi:hypothetical protein
MTKPTTVALLIDAAKVMVYGDVDGKLTKMIDLINQINRLTAVGHDFLKYRELTREEMNYAMEQLQRFYRDESRRMTVSFILASGSLQNRPLV